MKHKIRISFFLFLTMLIGSCVTHKKYPYLIQSTSSKDTIEINIKHPEYLLQKGDVLSIKITSTVASEIEVFNKRFEDPNLAGNNTAFSNYFNGYLIDNNGKIDLPLIGGISSEGLTCNQLNDTIQNKLSEYVRYANVTTKLGVFRVTILGEVTLPGTKDIVNTYNLNIYQAIGLAGDVTDVGNKRNIKLVRKEGDQITVVKLDLSNVSMIQSKYYYLQPNDVLYIEPLKAKIFRSNSSNITIALSALTFILVLLNYVHK